MSSSLPKISVITPVKNSAATFEKAIQSLIKQNYPNLEYIVIDGASTDGTLEIIHKYQKYITNWQSQDDGNVILAQLMGIKKASGDVICFLNADDFYEDESLMKVGKEFANDGELEMVSGRVRIVKHQQVNDTYQTIYESNTQDMVISPEKLIKVIAPNARFFKRKLFSDYQPFLTDDQGRALISSDLEYMINFNLRAVKHKIIDHVTYNYLAHQNSLTFSNSLNSKKRIYEERIFIAKKFLQQQKISLPKIWQKTFRKWIKKYQARIIAIDLKQKNWSGAKSVLKAGIEENGWFQFSFYLLKTLIRSRD